MKMDIQNLIETKSFEALNKAEKTFVLQNMTQVEYDEQHTIVQQSKMIFAEEYDQLLVKDEIRENALQKLRERKASNKKGLFYTMLNYKIPAWTAAAAVLLVAISLLTVYFQNNTHNQKSEWIGHVKDTIFLERFVMDTVKIFSNPDTIIERIYSSGTAQKKTKFASSSNSIDEKVEREINSNLFYSEDEELMAINRERSPIHIDLVNKSSGISLKQDSIARIVVGMGLEMM